jgi:hypothetical protein
MAQYRNFEIETTIVPDAAGQYEATFVVYDKPAGETQDTRAPRSPESGESAESPESHQDGGRVQGRRYAFPAVGSYLTPEDAREQTEAWARKWIDNNFGS